MILKNIKAKNVRNAALQIRFYAAAAILSLAVIYQASQQPARTAEVNQVQGIAIFTDCKPLQQYDYLGSVKVSFTMGSVQYASLRDKLIKKLKKDYPAADGAVFHFNTGNIDYCDAIKFKP